MSLMNWPAIQYAHMFNLLVKEMVLLRQTCLLTAMQGSPEFLRNQHAPSSGAATGHPEVCDTLYFSPSLNSSQTLPIKPTSSFQIPPALHHPRAFCVPLNYKLWQESEWGERDEGNVVREEEDSSCFGLAAVDNDHVHNIELWMSFR